MKKRVKQIITAVMGTMLVLSMTACGSVNNGKADSKSKTIRWKSSKVYDNGLKYEVLSKNEADVAPAYTTEGKLVNTDEYTLLEDDKHVWPPYNLAPVVRDNVLEAHPDVADIINKISAKFDTKTLTALNAKVDMDKEDYEKVAKDFYNSIK